MHRVGQRRRQLEMFHAVEKLGVRGHEFGARQCGAGAEMRALAKAQVVCGILAVQVELVRAGKSFLVAIAGPEPHAAQGALRNGGPGNLHIVHDFAPQALHRRLPA